MIFRYLRTILNFAFSKPAAGQRMWYLAKGILFAPWLAQAISGRSSAEQGAAANSQLGDDIYPLF